MKQPKQDASPSFNHRRRVARTVLVSHEVEKTILSLVARVPGASVHLALATAVELGAAHLDEPALLSAMVRRWSRSAR